MRKRPHLVVPANTSLLIACSASTIASIVLSRESGLSEMLSIPCATRNWANSGIVARRLAADADLPAGRVCRADHLRDGPLDGSLRSSKRCATSSESRSTPSTSWVRSLLPIEKPSKTSANSARQDHVAGDLAHHVDLEPALALHQSVAGHLRDHAPAFLDRSAERHHQLHVLSPISSRTLRIARHSSAKPSR